MPADLEYTGDEQTEVSELIVELPDRQLQIFRSGAGPVRIATAHTYLMGNARWFPLIEGVTGDDVTLWINPRGLGGSSGHASEDGDGFGEFTDDLDAVLTALGIDRWVVFATSSAAMAALVYGLERPAGIAALILNACAANSDFYSDSESVYSSTSDRAPDAAVATAAVMGGRVTPEGEAVWADFTFTTAFRDPRLIRKMTSLPFPRMSPDHLLATRAALGRFNVAHRLHELSMPILLTAGRHDVHCPVAHTIALAAGLRNCKLEIFERSGHFPFIEEPHRYRKVVTSFLEDCEAAS